jgi:hypothetical protein
MRKNMNKPTTHFSLHALAVGAVVLLAQNAQSQSVLYNNTSATQNANFNPAANVTFGNEVVLSQGAPFDTISQVAFQFDLTGTATFTGNEDVDVTLYENNGPVVQGANSPGSVYWTSGNSTLASQGLAGYTTGSTLTYSVPNVLVAPDLTLAVTFSNLQANDVAGLALYNPVTVGFNYDDAWVETSGVWALDKASGTNPPLLFGQTITGTPAGVPEPGTIALGVMGAVGFLARRRKS